MIPITKPFLPPKSEYLKFIDDIWDKNLLTNNGPLVKELEFKLKEYLGISYINFLGNGTIALQIAIKALELKGEIITTPFSYVATTSSIVWENCTPVFADIDPSTFNIDPLKIIEQISPKTSAILATHVFGNPCDLDSIQEIADKYKLKVIYDAAHAFGVKHKEQSILNYGDISTCSFHATKIFHTIEGGAVVTKDKTLSHKMSRMRNFGHSGPYEFDSVGINGKNSEVHAAMGLVNLKYTKQILIDRKRQHRIYDKILLHTNIKKQEISSSKIEYNYSYYPIIFETEKQLELVLRNLNQNDIYPRRYFYPSLSNLKYLAQSEYLEQVEYLTKRVLCLPSYYKLSNSDIEKITAIILNTLNQ